MTHHNQLELLASDLFKARAISAYIEDSFYDSDESDRDVADVIRIGATVLDALQQVQDLMMRRAREDGRRFNYEFPGGVDQD